MWCSEERGSRIIVLSWSLIPSQQDNNNNTMTSLDKQRHSVLYSFWDWTWLITHFSRRLVTIIINYCPNLPMLEKRSVISVTVHRNNWDRKIISRRYWRDGATKQRLLRNGAHITLSGQPGPSPCLSGQFRQDNRRAWHCQGKYVWR